MTPYNLEETVRRATKLVADNPNDRDLMLAQLFEMLSTLLRHEADIEADRNLQRRAVPQ